MKRYIIALLLLSLTALAGLPPTATLGTNDVNKVTTFNFDFPFVNITHTGVSAQFTSLTDPLFQHINTPVAPAVGFDKLYFKTDNIPYYLNSDGIETALQSAISGTPNTFAGFGSTGAIQTINGWGFGVTTTATLASNLQTYEVPPDGTSNTIKITNYETEWNAVSSNTDQNLVNVAIDSHVDRFHSGGDVANVTNIASSASVEGSGTVTSHTGMAFNQFFQGNSGGTTNFGYGLAFTTGVAPLYTVNNYQGINFNFFADVGSTIGAVSIANFGSSGEFTGNYSGIQNFQSGNVDGNYSGINIGDNGNVTGSAFSISSTFNGNVTGGYNGLSISQSGDTGGFQGINISQNSGNTGNAEGLRVGFSNGTATSKTAFTAIMGNGVTSNSGRIIDTSWGSGNYNDRISLNLGGGSGNITTSDTGVNLSQSSGISNSYTGLNLQANGTTTTDWHGITIDAIGTPTAATVDGIKINVSAISSPSQKNGLSVNGGALIVQSPYDTSVLPPSPFFGQLNVIGGGYTVASGFPATGSAMIGNNMSATGTFHDNMGPDGLGGLIGFTDVGFVTQIAVDAGKTVDTVNMAAAGASVPTGSGSVTTSDMYRALGYLGFGGTLSVGNLTGFHGMSSLCSMSASCWGVKIDDTSATNSFAKNVVVGSTVTANSSVGIEISGTAKAFLNARLTTTQRNALTATEGMMIQNTTTNTLQFYNGTQWVDTSSGGVASGGVIAFTQSGGTSVMEDFGNPYTFAETATVTAVQVGFLNGGTSGSTDFTVNQYRSGAFFNSVTGTIPHSSGLPFGGTVTLSGPLSVVADDVITVDIDSVAGGFPEDLSILINSGTLAGPAGPSGASGASGTNGASAIPSISGTASSPLNITAAGGIPFGNDGNFNYKTYINGSGGAVTVTANPQIAACTSDGQTLVLVGRSSTNTVTIVDAPSNGVSLNGTWVAGLNSVLRLGCDTNLNWVEESRR